MRRREAALGLGAMTTLATLQACVWQPPPLVLQATPLASAGELPPPMPREFRAAWVASVSHIDWPSRAGLNVAEQRAELRRAVQTARSIGLNALLLQVRASADAIFPSALEPWAEVLTGAQGRAPDPPWDPLAEWLAEARAAGLELHA